HFPWVLTSQKNTDNAVAQLNEEVMRGTSQEVEGIFGNVLSAKHLVKDVFNQGLVDPYSLQQQADFYLSLLKANPNFTWVQLGYANGDYIGVQRRPDGLFNVIVRQWDNQLGELASPGSPLAEIQTKRAELIQEYLKTQIWPTNIPTAQKTVISYNLFEAELEKVEETKTTEVYYAPVRPFYQKAAENPGEDVWTDIYVFKTGNAVGLDSSTTYQRPSVKEPFLGVISISFELRQISDYLSKLELAKTGAVFIVNDSEQLLAFTNPEKLAGSFVGEEQPKLKQFWSIDDRFLNIANDGLKTKNVALKDIKDREILTYTDPNSGEKYYIDIKRLDYFDWMVVTVTPESIFLTEINRNKQILAIVVLGLVLVGSVGALILSDRAIAQPILAITNAASAIEAGQFATEILDKPAKRTDELGKLAQVFQDMARQVYAREESLKRQVQQLEIQIDESKRQQSVREITESDFFYEMQAKAKEIRQRRKKRSPSIPPNIGEQAI
ncbi:MAG: HAMP domain-containing protein, partial [Prochlorotrichaceae cyanobacterium]